MLLRVGKFEKVSYKQFKKDWLATFNPVLQKGDKIPDAEIKFIYEHLKTPTRATKGSMGYDFFTPISFGLEPSHGLTIPTGFRVIPEEGWGLLEFPRSGLGFNYRFQLDNTIGVIDQDYHESDNEGHIFVKMSNDGVKRLEVQFGEAFVQGIFVQFGVTYDDNVTTKRNGGFGSTSKKPTEPKVIDNVVETAVLEAVDGKKGKATPKKVVATDPKVEQKPVAPKKKSTTKKGDADNMKHPH